MNIQVSKDLDVDKIRKEIKQAKIVEEGDYILYENISRILVYDTYDEYYLKVSDVSYIEVSSSSLWVHTDSAKYSCKYTLRELEILPLLRINKSCLINLEQVNDVKVKLNMKYALKIHELWFDVNRTYLPAFKAALNIRGGKE